MLKLTNGDKKLMLTFIEELPPLLSIDKKGYTNKRRRGLFSCDCGLDNIMEIYNFGKTNSCGCYARRVATKHGMEGTRFYGIWQGIKKRVEGCGEYNKQYYSHLGMEDRWSDFIPFMEDMYDSYITHSQLHGEHNTSIDRVNNDEGYYIRNCRWATRGLQQRNQSKNIFFEKDGEVLCLKDWCNKFDINYKVAHNRYRYQGWSIEEVLGLKERLCGK